MPWKQVINRRRPVVSTRAEKIRGYDYLVITVRQYKNTQLFFTNQKCKLFYDDELEGHIKLAPGKEGLKMHPVYRAVVIKVSFKRFNFGSQINTVKDYSIDSEGNLYLQLATPHASAGFGKHNNVGECRD